MRSESSFRVKLFAALILAFAMVVLSLPHPAKAAVQRVADIGSWQLICTPSVLAADDCAIVQATIDPETRRDARVAFFFTVNGELSMRLRMWEVFGDVKRVALLADGEQVGSVTAGSCEGGQCEAVTQVSDLVAKQLFDARRLALAASTGVNKAAYSTFDVTKLKDAVKEMYNVVSRGRDMPLSHRYRSLLFDTAISPLVAGDRPPSTRGGTTLPAFASNEIREALPPLMRGGFLSGETTSSLTEVVIGRELKQGKEPPSSDEPTPIPFRIVNPGKE